MELFGNKWFFFVAQSSKKVDYHLAMCRLRIYDVASDIHFTYLR